MVQVGWAIEALGRAVRGCGFCLADPEYDWNQMPKRKCRKGHDMQLIMYDAFPRGQHNDMEYSQDGHWRYKDGQHKTAKERGIYFPVCYGPGCGGTVMSSGEGLISSAPYFQCLRCEDDACCDSCGQIDTYTMDKGGVMLTLEAGDIATPPLWKHQNPEQTRWEGDAWEKTVDVTAEMLTAFQNLVNDTYKPKATRDRAKLGAGEVPQSLKVVKVLRQEQIRLWLRYQGWKQIMQRLRCGWQKERKCTPVNELDGKPLSGFSKVHAALGGTGLDDELDADVNETYMFHGTSAAGAQGITETGFHVRGKAGSHAGLMFGPGAYLAEMSSKADEYASGGDGEYEDQCCMLLCRAVLGELYYTTQPDQTAIADALLSGEYDSVLGDREAAVGTYREFVVRRQEVLYPEYIIVYERVYADGKKRKPAKFTNRE